MALMTEEERREQEIGGKPMVPGVSRDGKQLRKLSNWEKARQRKGSIYNNDFRPQIKRAFKSMGDELKDPGTYFQQNPIMRAIAETPKRYSGEIKTPPPLAQPIDVLGLATPRLPQDNDTSSTSPFPDQTGQGQPEIGPFDANRPLNPKYLREGTDMRGAEFDLPPGIQREPEDNSYTGTSAGAPRYGGEQNPANPFGRSDVTQQQIQANVAGYDRAAQALKELRDARSGRDASGWIPGSSRGISEAQRSANYKSRQLMDKFEKALSRGGSKGRKEAALYLKAAQDAGGAGIARDAMTEKGAQFAQEQEQFAQEQAQEQQQFGVGQGTIRRGQDMQLLSAQARQRPATTAKPVTFANQMKEQEAQQEFADTFQSTTADSDGISMPQASLDLSKQYSAAGVSPFDIKRMYDEELAKAQLTSKALTNPEQIAKLNATIGQRLAAAYPQYAPRAAQ